MTALRMHCLYRQGLCPGPASGGCSGRHCRAMRRGALPWRAGRRRAFEQAKALVFVGAAGIAVRACAPCLSSKDVDPAVVAVDECGPLCRAAGVGASGRRQRPGPADRGRCAGPRRCITTATDANGVFAVDSWAVRQGCTVRPVAGIKTVSAKLLAGEQIRLRSDWPIPGTPPAGVLPVAEGPCDVHLTLSAPAGERTNPCGSFPKSCWRASAAAKAPPWRTLRPPCWRPCKGRGPTHRRCGG